MRLQKRCDNWASDDEKAALAAVVTWLPSLHPQWLAEYGAAIVRVDGIGCYPSNAVHAIVLGLDEWKFTVHR